MACRTQIQGVTDMNIIDFLPDATLVIDAAGCVIAWNRAMEEMTGVPASEMLGKGNYEYAIPFYGERRPILANLIFMPAEEIEQRYDSVQRDGETLVVDIFIPTLGEGGTCLWAKAAPLYDEAGKLTGAIQTIRDITERRRASQEIEQSKNRLSEILSFLPDATLAIDLQGRVIVWNREMELLTGVPASEIMGKGDMQYGAVFYGEPRPILVDLVLMPDADLEKNYRTVKREGDTLFADTFVPRFREQGAYLWAKASPLYDQAGNVVGAIETIRDITDRILADERLARANAELQIAAEIQQSFLPSQIPRIEGFDIAARSVMAKEVGGDFFDVIPFEVISFGKGSFGLLIADVSGKGIPAALFMALSRIVVRINAFWHNDPATVIHHSNNFITQDSKTGMFVTLFYGILSEHDQTLTYVNAGHNPPLVYRAADATIETLDPTGIFLGGLEDQEYRTEKVKIGPDDVAVLYTDGVTESINAAVEMFGETRLKELIRLHAKLTAAEIMEKILEAVNLYAEDLPQFDDITLMVIKGTR